MLCSVQSDCEHELTAYVFAIGSKVAGECVEGIMVEVGEKTEDRFGVLSVFVVRR